MICNVPGLVLRRLAAGPGRPREAIGVDRSVGMLARVGDLPSGWSTLHADARHVALPAGCADVVTCSHVLHLLDRAERADVIAEAKRLLAASTASRLVTVSVWSDDSRVRGRLISRALRAATRARRAAWCGLVHSTRPRTSRRPGSWSLGASSCRAAATRRW